MIVKNLSRLVSLIVLIILITNTAWANLMITPQRVVFEEKQRSASVNLINTTTQTNTYRLHWVQKRQREKGGYQDLPQNSNEVPNASSMLRFSPRQITLAPGEKQTVRISLRRKKGLETGEHRSYLLFQALPNETPASASEKGPKVKINLLLGFAIPVIVREGKINASATISGVVLTKTMDKNKYVYGAQVNLKRSGPHTAIGSIKILWKKTKFEEYKQIGLLNNVSLYPEAPLVQNFVGLPDFKVSSGYMKITYEGQKEFEGKVFDTSETKVTQEDFKLVHRDDI